MIKKYRLLLTFVLVFLPVSFLVSEDQNIDPALEESARRLVNSEENLANQEDKLKQMEADLLSQLDAPESKGAETQVAVVKVEEPKAALKVLKKIEKDPVINPEKKNATAVSVKAPVKTVVKSETVLKQKNLEKLSAELAATKQELSRAKFQIDKLSDELKFKKEDEYLELTEQNARAERFVERDIENNAEYTSPKIERYDSQDSDYAIITAANAPLRISPGSQDSILYYIPEQSRVHVEKRTGEWLRVVAPNGVRGWVYGGSVTFFPVSNPDSAVRIKAFSAQYEPVRSKY